jgi:predicted MFS family arabinose efflux permease
MGLVGMAFGLCFVFGPILGGFLAEINYLFAGYAAAGFSFSAFLVSLFFLPESNPVTKASNNIAFAKPKIFNIEAMKKLAGISPQTVMIGMFFVLTFSVANIYGTFALLGTEIYRFTELKVGLTYGIMGITSATMQGGGIRILSKYINDRKLIIVGTFALMAALGLMPFGVNFLGTAIVCVILSIGTGILQPTILSLVSKVTDDSEQGVVLGVNQSLSSLARMLGPLWGGFAFQYIGYEFPFLTGAFFTFFILLFAIFYFNRYIKEEQPDPEKQC